MQYQYNMSHMQIIIKHECVCARKRENERKNREWNENWRHQILLIF